MNGILVRWLTLTGAIIFTSYLLDGIQVRGFVSAFFAAAILGILNALFRPILILLTLPINILTLGFFTFVINALMLKMASGVITGFEVHGFWSAVFGALIISIISWLLNSFISERGTVTYYSAYRHTGRPQQRPPHDRNRLDNDTIDLVKKEDDRWE
jgi:putative membrane protein